MSKPKGTIPSVPIPVTRTIYDCAPKPKNPVTPQCEYAFMQRSFPIWGITPSKPTGPVNGGVAQ